MPDIEHPLAVYYDEQTAKRHEIRAEELLNDKVLARAKTLNLLDASEQVCVIPRISHKGTPHFVAKAEGIRRVFDSEKDPTHDRRIGQLVRDLQSLDVWTLSQLRRDEPSGNMLYEHNEKLPKYQWQPEVHRILTETAIVRHDIFGQSDELAMSIGRPWVAIEVINTHFPDEDAFKALIDTSRRMPLLVLFDFTEFQDAFVKVEKNNARLVYRPWTYMIREGYLLKGQSKTGITTGAEFRIKAERMLEGWRKKRANAG